MTKVEGSSWNTIQMGNREYKDYTAVWDLVCQSSEFELPNELSCYLRKEWEGILQMSKVKDSETRDQVVHFIESIKGQMSKIEHFDLLQNVIFEMQVVLRLQFEKRWLAEHIKEKEILEILRKDPQYNSMATDVNDSIVQICQMLGEDVNVLNTDTVMSIVQKGLQSASKVKQSENIKMLSVFLNDILSNGNKIQDQFGKHQKGANQYLIDFWGHCKVEVEIKNLLRYMQEHRECVKYISLMGIILSHGYDFGSMSFSSRLTMSTIKTLSESVLESLKKRRICSQETIVKDLVAQATKKDASENRKNLVKKAMYNLRNVPIGLQQNIRRILFTHADDFASIVKHLERFEKNNCRQETQIGTHLKWNMFEKLRDRYFTDAAELNMKSTDKERSGDLQPTCDLGKILNTLGLQSKFPRKISLQDVQSVHDNMFSEPRRVTEIPWVILRKIFAVDFSFREGVLDRFISKQCSGDSESESDEKDDTYDSLQRLHPSDVLLAILSCCDMHLQKVLIEKIVFCQIAIPFIYQSFIEDELVASSWCLHGIIQGSKCSSVLAMKAKKVSFIRIGDFKTRSKSKLINEFLRDQNEEHSTYFHRDCEMGYNSRTISNGVIEISWLQSSSGESQVDVKEDKEQGIAKDTNEEKYALSILNLRGDANSFPMQVKILCQISDLLVVCVDSESLQSEKCQSALKNIHDSPTGVLLVTQLPSVREESEKVLQRYYENVHIPQDKTAILSLFDTKTRRKLNNSEIKKALFRKVSKCLAKVTCIQSLEDLLQSSTISKDCLILDEWDEVCSKGKDLAKSLCARLKSIGASSIKDHTLPLQGNQFWHTWSEKQKKSMRSGRRERYDEEKENLKGEMQKIRQQQISMCNKTNGFMENFVKILHEHTGNEDVLIFLLSWLKHMLDDESRRVLPQHQYEFKRIFIDLVKAVSDDEKQKFTKQLDEVEQRLINASFGLEHCFREIGQIYEAFISETDDNKTQIDEKTMIVLMNLPHLIAKLILMGLPLELMDGDAANVPIRWLKAVFSALSKQGSFKIGSVSVLGIQSSGKSTLLNSMFGLQFAVSAGRCTRGVYSQLIPVSKARSSLAFDYIMVIDTEGLRAPELSGEKFDHDNELATFVIGLGDYVIINIKGETMADMENVLQIVVHGLMRLKQANNKLQLKQSCTFVHQNVSANDAAKQMQQGHRKIMQNLDAMAKEVAKQEHMSQVTAFKDVIAFDPTKSGKIQYIPDLWHGSPPMAPCSVKYSAKVTEAACNIIEETKSIRCGSHVDDAFRHLQDLWNGILKEDFVFSFRNSLEVKAYNVLDAKFQQCTWAVEETKLEWLNKNIKPKLGNCENKSALNDCVGVLLSSIYNTMNHKAAEVKDDFQNFMAKSDLQDHMIHWKENKLRSIDNLVEELQSDMCRRVRESCDQFELDLNSRSLLESKEKEINLQAQILANSLKGKNPGEDELLDRFEKMWKQWFDEISSNIHTISPADRNANLKRAMKNTLYNKFDKYGQLVQNGLDSCDLDNGVTLQKLTGTFALTGYHLNIMGFYANVKNTTGFKNFIAIAKIHVDDVLNELDGFFKTWSKQDTEFGSTELSHLLRRLDQRIQKFNTNGEFTFNHNMLVDVALHVSRHAFREFSRYNGEFAEKRSVKEKLKAYRPKALQIFNDTVTEKTKELIAANILCMEMKDIVAEKVRRDISDMTVATMKTKFSFMKFHLLKDILLQLGSEEENFEEYMHYIESPYRYARQWFGDATDAELFEIKAKGEKNRFQEWTENGVKSLIQTIIRAVDNTPRHPDSMNDWLTKFRSNIDGNHLFLTSSSFSHVMDYEVGDFENFCECVKRSLLEKEEELLNTYRVMPAEDVDWGDKRPHDSIFESLWGCGEDCPFCGEPCQYNRNHSSDTEPHRCLQHRPRGIGRVTWSDTSKLVFESCNFAIQSTSEINCSTSWCYKCEQECCSESHPYKDYKKYIPEWDIAPQSDMSESKYWTWFLVKYNEQLAERYHANPADIPDSFRKISQNEAMDSLSVHTEK